MNSDHIFLPPDGKLTDAMKTLAAATGRTISRDEPAPDAVSGTYNELISKMTGELDTARSQAPNDLDRRVGENRKQYRARTNGRLWHQKQEKRALKRAVSRRNQLTRELELAEAREVDAKSDGSL